MPSFSPSPRLGTPAETTTDRVVLAVILGVAFFLRFFRPEAHGLDWDEAIVRIMATTPLSYMVHWSSTVEVHPPTFYALLKGINALFGFTAAIHELLTLATVGCIFLTYRLGRRLFDTRVGLVAAALMAVNAIDIMTARTVRPHALTLFFSLWSLDILFAWLRSREDRKLLGLAVSNALGLLFHYMMAVILVCQGCVVLYWLLRERRRPWRTIVLFGVAGAAAFVPVSYFFVETVFSRSDMVFSSWSYVHVLKQLDHAYLMLLKSFVTFDESLHPAGIAAIGVTLALLLVFAWRTRSDKAGMGELLIYLIVPYPLLLATRHGYVMYKYLQFLLPVMALMVSWAIFSLIPRLPAVVVALALVVCGGFNQFVWHYAVYYAPQNGGNYQIWAKRLAQSLGPATMVGFADEGVRNAVNLYYDTAVAQNYLRDTQLTPEDTQAEFLCAGGEFFSFAKTPAELEAKLGPADSRQDGPGGPLLRWRFPRRPLTAVTALPFTETLGMSPKAFLSRVSEMRHLMFLSSFGDGVCPTRIEAPSRMAWDFRNVTGQARQMAGFAIRYENTGQDNLLVVRVRFDDEPPLTLFRSKGPDPFPSVFLPVGRDKPFSRLRLEIELTVAPVTPIYTGPNYGTLRIKGVEAGFFDYTGRISSGYPEDYMRLFAKSAVSAEPGRFRAVGYTRGNTGLKEASHFKDGITCLVPTDGKRGVLTLETQEPIPYFLFMPRVAGNDSAVRVYAVSGDKQRLVWEIGGVQHAWTDERNLYPVRLPAKSRPGAKWRIELIGPGSQLWLKDGRAFFTYGKPS